MLKLFPDRILPKRLRELNKMGLFADLTRREVRVVDGLGYTRVRPRDDSGDAAVSRSGSGDTAGASIDSGGSSGGSVSSQGYASGGGGSDSGRTAEPR